MSERLDAAIYGAIATTLENMAFLEVGRGTDDAVHYPEAENLVCRLLILDPMQGEFYLVMPVPLLKKIAASVYIMAEEEVAEQMQLDMLGELINTAAGLFLNGYLPGSQTYSLGLPETRVEMPDDAPIVGRQWEFNVDSIIFSLVLTGDGFPA
jgi:hypothetical protein